jgi:hypothetical protein
MAFTHTKKVNIGPFIKARIRIGSKTSGSGSDQKGPDPDLYAHHWFHYRFFLKGLYSICGLYCGAKHCEFSNLPYENLLSLT